MSKNLEGKRERPKAIAYLRVSTDKQSEQGLGLEIQEAAVRKWAREHGYRLSATFRDEGISGSNGLKTREGLADALASVAEGGAKALVVYRLDRLSRDMILQEQLIADIRRMNADLFTTSAAETENLTDDPEDPSRKLIRRILGAIVEYERDMIALRLRAGRRRKAEKGGFAFGSPSYGFRAEGGKLVQDPDEQAVVARIAALRQKGDSFRQISATLTVEGHRPKRSDQWHVETLRRIVGRIDEVRGQRQPARKSSRAIQDE